MWKTCAKKQVCYRRDRKKEDDKIPAIQQCMVGIFCCRDTIAKELFMGHDF